MKFGFQWALIELSKNPDIQTKLRAELLEFGADPTYDQLPNNLPYLDAVVHETLRMHSPLPDFTRMASTGDGKAHTVSNPLGTGCTGRRDPIKQARTHPIWQTRRPHLGRKGDLPVCFSTMHESLDDSLGSRCQGVQA